ncbi:hypothetical protein PG994_013474 [Apiospora phragmitis]|uniref:Nucleotidyl transferase AbiEii/AbiGii toxin family protein n=1 Tax=Apiospora phragmitis TaxID=2905665 RepID=A0ABR1T8Q6_9PEZI
MSDPNPAPKPTRQHIIDAAAAAAFALGDKVPYALVSGGACSVLGSQRVTEDIDIVVPQGRTSEARQLLRELPDYFDVAPRTLHTYFRSEPAPVRVELLAPPGMFREAFTEATPTLAVHDGRVRVLKPTLLLNTKCGSVQNRRSEERKRSDALDILFLLQWCHRNALYPTGDEVPNATEALVQTFIGLFPCAEHWINAGYDLHGRFTGAAPNKERNNQDPSSSLG